MYTSYISLLAIPRKASFLFFNSSTKSMDVQKYNHGFLKLLHNFKHESLPNYIKLLSWILDNRYYIVTL